MGNLINCGQKGNNRVRTQSSEIYPQASLKARESPGFFRSIIPIPYGFRYGRRRGGGANESYQEKLAKKQTKQTTKLTEGRLLENEKR